MRKSITFSVCLALIVLFGSGNLAIADQFYTVDRTADQLGIIDTTTATYNAIGPIGYDMHATQLTRQTGILYALTGNADGFNSTAHTLVGINPQTGNMTTDVNVTYNNQNLYLADGLESVNGKLVIAFRDPGLGVGDSCQLLGDLSLSGVITNVNNYSAYNPDFDAIAATPAGQIYSADGIPGQQTFNLYSVARSPLSFNSYGSYHGGTTANPFTSEEMTFGPTGLYVMNPARDEIYLIDSTTHAIAQTLAYPGRGGTLTGLQTVPTPEPTTFVLLGSALLLIGGHRFLRWRRSKP